jgi:hypothetical protein
VERIEFVHLMSSVLSPYSDMVGAEVRGLFGHCLFHNDPFKVSLRHISVNRILFSPFSLFSCKVPLALTSNIRH